MQEKKRAPSLTSEIYFFSEIRGLGQKILARILRKKDLLKLFACLSFIGIVYTILAYRGDGLTIGGDNVIPLHPLEYLGRLPYSSNPWAGFGSPLPPIFALPPLPDILLFSSFSSLNFDIYVGNKLYVFVLATFSAVSIFYLSTTVFHESRSKILIGIVATIAYLYNPLVYADTYKTMVFMELSLVQTGFMLFMAFVIRYFQTMRIRYSLYAGFSSFLMFSNPGISAYRLAFLALFGFLGVTFYYWARCRGTSLRTKAANAFKAFAVVAVLGFLLNSYWIISFLQNAGPYSSLASEFQTSGTFNEFSNMVNTLRLLNSWSFHTGFVPYADVYLTNPVMIILTFAWPLFAFFPLLSREAIKHRKILALYLATILTILLAWGSDSPFSQVYMTVVNIKIGSYYFLRPFYNTGVFGQLVLTLEYALLIGLFSSLAYSWLMDKCKGFNLSKRKKASVCGAVSIVIILASSSWPILTGDVMRNWYNPDQYGVHIPECYWAANEYIEEICDLNHKILLLPATQIYVGTSWGYQGTSQFYNLMFNVPLITGNEIPYRITANETLINRIYSNFYRAPDANDTMDVINQTDNIITWQNDKAILTEQHLQVDFNNTYEVGKWHQVELRLPFAGTWSNFTHMIFQFSGELSLDRLEIGIGDTMGYVGWWSADKHLCQVDNGTLIPIEKETEIVQDNEMINLLLPLRELDRSTYSINNVTSAWIQYFVANSSGVSTLQIDKILVGKVSVDDLYYANLLSENTIKYLLVDLAIKDGTKSDPKFWLDLLTDSDYFRLIWQKDTLYIFENTIFQ